MSISNAAAFLDSVRLTFPEISSWISSYSSNSWETTAKIAALKVASCLTDPICKVREYFYTFYILDQTCQDTAQKVTKVVTLTLGMIAYTVLAPFTTPVGAAIRGMIALVQSEPYIYLERPGIAKTLPHDKKISIASHNQCYMPAGYSITDGHVTPPSDKERMDANLQKIKELNPDVVCLYEVPDIYDAEYLSSQLTEYPFLIPVAGVQPIGLSSMLYVASKYEIAKESIEFIPFVKGTELTGRAQFSEKGFLSFDLKSCGADNSFATVVSTHLQHSEIPAIPDDGERQARALQMNKIAGHIKTKVDQGGAVIFTGDLNQEESELNRFLAGNHINWLRRDPSVLGESTWGGDQWCADLMGKPASNPLVLDYTLIAGKIADISTDVIGTGYSGLEFRAKATSDHYLLFSTITLA